jgi:hypothetical protein
MPVGKAKGGYRYRGAKGGGGGKVYHGRNAKAKAAKQGRAIALSKARAAGHKVPAPR